MSGSRLAVTQAQDDVAGGLVVGRRAARGPKA
jgi:hypothetical protein